MHCNTLPSKREYMDLIFCTPATTYWVLLFCQQCFSHGNSRLSLLSLGHFYWNKHWSNFYGSKIVKKLLNWLRWNFGASWTDYSIQINLKHSQLQYMNFEIDHNVTRPTLVVFTMEFSLKRVARLETIFRFSSHESHSRSLSLLITAKRAENFHK